MSAGDSSGNRSSEPVEIFLGHAQSEIALKTEMLQQIFGKEHYDWSVDLEVGVTCSPFSGR